jgi:23S rRNA pseudouridine1911/1915/1917 synthase
VLFRSGRTLLDIELETGRLHQIRAHMAELGCPVCGDRVYRVDLPPNTGTSARAKGPPLALHAWELAFAHPVTGARVTVRAPMPASMVDLAASSGIVLPREMRPPA